MFGWKRRNEELSIPARVRGLPGRDGIAIVAIVKDEAHYLAEWLAFHVAVGVNDFFLYDNGSTDNTLAVAQRMSAFASIQIIPWISFSTDIRVQAAAYNHAVVNFGMRFRWFAFIDVDEFVFPKHDESLPLALGGLSHVPAVSIPWHMFGPCGHQTKPRGLVIESYLSRAPFPPSAGADLMNYKTIADPVAVKWARAHFCELWEVPNTMFNDEGQRFRRSDRFTVEHATTSRLQLNHYFTRSLEEFERKIAKRRVSKEGTADNRSELEERLKAIARDTVSDTSILRFAPAVRTTLDNAGFQHRKEQRDRL